MSKPGRALVFTATLFFFAVAGLVLWTGYLSLQGGNGGEIVDILIPRGATLNQVTHLLVENGVVTRPKLFNALLRITRGSTKVRAGEFEFRKQMSSVAALKLLYHEEPVVHEVTIPEGWTIRQIAKLLADEQLVNEEKFVALALGPEMPKRYKLTCPGAEGFLFPDTYKFSRVDGELKILERMVSRFFETLTEETRKELKANKWTVEQLVTLASIIEKETGVAEERALVSSVFHNRLKKRMRLQSDPTTIYGIPDFNGNLTREDLRRYSPYNTYVIQGLPPGPIASPGSAALLAALHPAESDYLFFVASKEGQHIFTKTYGQHAREVEVHQKRSLSRENRKKQH